MRSKRTQLNEKDVQLVCVHWKSFPPKGSTYKQTPEELKLQGKLDNSEYEHYKIWSKVCGLMEMNLEKCLTCPHVRTAEFKSGLPCLVTLDGKLATPSLDATSLECSTRHRKFLESVVTASNRPKA